jgi:signal transduction histidine kinase
MMSMPAWLERSLPWRGWGDWRTPRAPAWLRRLWPRRLAGQMIALLLLALILAQSASYLIFADERWAALQTAERRHILARTASIVRLIENTPATLDRQILHTASTRELRFWLSDQSAVAPADADANSWLRRRLLSLLDDGSGREVLVNLGKSDQHFWSQGDTLDRDERIAAIGEMARAGEIPPERAARWHAHWQHRLLPADLMISTRLKDGRWLNAGLAVPERAPHWTLATLLAMTVTAAALSLVVIVMVRRITRPMAELANAAERLGRGETVPPIALHGPLDIRQTMRAFNRMRGRLQRFVQDRTRMVAAISHDLRTPITSLRLHAEFVDDEETRAKILETLDEMQRMIEATLAFAREEAAAEDTRTVDLAALVESVVDDLADLGQEVTFSGPERLAYACRPVGLKRAVRNLIENAVAYGGRARVTLEPGAVALRVVIDDDGPGIPEADFERVFAPFVRLEESRSRETGGIGLGMAIARSIVRGHGGDIELANRPEGGLRVVISLPKAEAA